MIDFDKLVLVPLVKVFGEPEEAVPSYQPDAGGDPYPLHGIFTKGFKSPAIGDDGMPTWNTTAPTFGALAADFQVAPLKNDVITIQGTDYMVMDARPDGVGWIVLVLKVTE